MVLDDAQAQSGTPEVMACHCVSCECRNLHCATATSGPLCRLSFSAEIPAHDASEMLGLDNAVREV